MPSIAKEQRASGSWVSPEAKRRRRVYTRDDAARPCEACGFPIVRQLVEADPTIRTHPSCEGA